MNYKNYQEGQISELGIPIFQIVAIAENVIVYFDKEYSLIYEFEKEELATDTAAVNLLCQSLKQKIPEGVPFHLLKELRRELGHCLFSALRASDFDKSKELFQSFIEKINKVKPPEYAALEYIFISLIISFLFATPLTVFYFYLNNNWEWSIVFLYGAAGIIGSLFSVLQRNLSYELDLTASRGLVIMQSVSRVMSGLLAAVILYLASKSNIALGFAADNQNSLLLFCILAGFSERLIPDLFRRLEDNV